jgi:tetraacyldisaccharide-1-P 4'-kinase
MWPLSRLFQLIVTFRFGLFVLGYKAQAKLSVPVIVVGNIYVGGTGKTSLVIWLAAIAGGGLSARRHFAWLCASRQRDAADGGCAGVTGRR